MLASRTLPPIPFRTPEPLPVATFVNIPRRYTKTKMQPGNDGPDHAMIDADTSPRRRKSSRLSGSSIASSEMVRSSRDAGEPAAALSSPRVLRKRASPSEDEFRPTGPARENHHMDSKPSHGSASTPPGEVLSGHFCLCQPQPKIPRPRNAFILYRQHHQHAIVSRHPALTNPEISKIIGEQWNAESPETKIIWQNLAQEEKAKHQEQYPDYRYQPRRAGPRSSGSVEHTTVEKHRCDKCGGRKILNSSVALSTPTPTLHPPLPPEAPTPTSAYLPPMSNLSLESPAHRRLRPGSSLSHPQVLSPMQADTPAVYTPGTPDSKRRRYNYSQMTNGRRGDSSYYPVHRRESQPQISVQYASRTPPPNPAIMHPPSPRNFREPRRGSVDLNLHVPDNADQSRSVEAMVMSVPYPIKIKVLGRITPPFKKPGPTSPAIPVRGAIIAIEGDDLTAVYQLSRWLKEDLAKGNELQPHIEEPPRVPDEEENVSFEGYLDLIKEWHIKSRKMIEYITTPAESSETKDEKETPKEEKGKGKETEKEKEKQKEKEKDSKPTVKAGEPQKIPVAILPTYQLHASNVFTSRIPIQDAYSPTDHWQWMATLWRGTVGPDLTIYIQTPDPKEPSPTKLVDVNYDVRCMTVRREKGSDFEPAALRRVGFEVSEWVHDVSKKAS